MISIQVGVAAVLHVLLVLALILVVASLILCSFETDMSLSNIINRSLKESMYLDFSDLGKDYNLNQGCKVFEDIQRSLVNN